MQRRLTEERQIVRPSLTAEKIKLNEPLPKVYSHITDEKKKVDIAVENIVNDEQHNQRQKAASTGSLRNNRSV